MEQYIHRHTKIHKITVAYYIYESTLGFKKIRKGRRHKVMQELISKEEERVYLAEDIQKILNIGRSKTYEYLKEVFKTQEPFRFVKIGKLFRVPKRSFDNWISGKDE